VNWLLNAITGRSKRRGRKTTKPKIFDCLFVCLFVYSSVHIKNAIQNFTRKAQFKKKDETTVHVD